MDELRILNGKAVEEANRFMVSVPPERSGVIDSSFHYQKNHFPYFGFIDATVGEARFVMFSANDDLVAMTFFWFGADSYEPMSMQLWHESAKKAQTVLDVGSFSGVYSLTAATCNPNCQVYAIEAARRTYGRLLVNTQVNMLTDRIHCTNRAVSKDEGFETFMRFRGENILGIGDSFVPKNIEAQASEERVHTIALDSFCTEHAITPDLIKIDVEGAELLAMDGMKDILAARRATMLIEVTPQTAPEAVRRLLDGGYSVQRIDERARTLIPCDNGQVPGVVNLFVEPQP